MLKKISTIFIVLIIISLSSVSVFAGQTEDAFGSDITAAGSKTSVTSNTGNTASNTTSAPSSTTGAATSVTGSTSGNTTAGKNAVSGKGTVTGQTTEQNKAAAEEKKPDFESFINAVMKKGNAVNNSLDIITITSPEKDKESTYEETYILSGNTKHSDVAVTIARYNEETGEYERIKNTDGESSWEIGSIRIFTKEIMLNKGTNKIMIISYRASQKEEATVDNVQFNCFTIEKLDKSIKDEIIKITKEAATNIGEGFKAFMEIIGKKQD